MPPYLILGCGYTASRVAERLAAEGENVVATTRDVERARRLTESGVRVVPLELANQRQREGLATSLTDGTTALVSIPPRSVGQAQGDPLVEWIAELAQRCKRIVYLSSTGVYGTFAEVDDQTAAAPVTPSQIARRATEEALLDCGTEALVLRPAAIYGPGRGVHASIRSGRFRLVGTGERIGSRIHVDDLATCALAALRGKECGALPIADAEPARERDVAALCAELLGVPLPGSVPAEKAHETRRHSRAVNARGSLERLGVELAFPSYRQGIPAALAAEVGDQ